MQTLSCSMRNLVLSPGIEPRPLPLGARSLNHLLDPQTHLCCFCTLGQMGMQQTGLALLALAACVAFRPSEAILPIASSCCTEVSHHISRRLLERVTTCRIQRADGDCDLAAVILHVKRRRVCVSPHNHVIKQWMNEQAAKKEAKGNICHKKRHHGRRNSKGAHRERQETHGHKTPY
uniref:C-C motif chemokine n=1 Tax=Bos taurus TaxID=9913 RepID=A0ABI0NYI2_BOVIN